MHALTNRILEFNNGRLPDALQVKYKAMTENAFRFYRGTCHLFYEDLSHAHKLPPSPLTWICGDLHLENFGTYKGDNRLVYFDLNDFDESILAPAAWELIRIVTSIFIAFESLDIAEKQALNMAQLFLKSYSGVLSKGKAYYIEPQTASGIVRTFLEKVSRRKQKSILHKRTVLHKNGGLLLKNNAKYFQLDKFLKRELEHHVTEWIIYNHDGPYNYEVIDSVFRLAGTGSLGLKRYALLLRSVKEPDKHLLVDMKQATRSSLHPYVKIPQPQWESEAERIAAVQQRMQNIPPALLSTTVFQDEPFLIQEMQPTKDSINFELIKDRYRDIYKVIDDMAILTASAQLRSSGRQSAAVADELIAFGQNDQWQKAILDYALHYKKIVKADFKTYVADYKKGALEKS